MIKIHHLVSYFIDGNIGSNFKVMNFPNHVVVIVYIIEVDLVEVFHFFDVVVQDLYINLLDIIEV